MLRMAWGGVNASTLNRGSPGNLATRFALVFVVLPGSLGAAERLAGPACRLGGATGRLAIIYFH